MIGSSSVVLTAESLTMSCGAGSQSRGIMWRIVREAVKREKRFDLKIVFNSGGDTSTRDSFDYGAAKDDNCKYKE
jgi:hypothetical protein